MMRMPRQIFLVGAVLTACTGGTVGSRRQAVVTSIAGVPVYNYHLSHNQVRPRGVSAPLERKLGEGHVYWLLTLRPENCTVDAMNRICLAFQGSGGCLLRSRTGPAAVCFVRVCTILRSLSGALHQHSGVVVAVEPDLMVRSITFPADPFEEPAQPSAPSWGLDRVDGRGPPDGRFDSPPDAGRGVHIYVCDTGIRGTHEDFGSRVVPTLDLTTQALLVCDGVDPDCGADLNGHGSHVAGTAAGATYGVAKGATLHSVKVLGDRAEGWISWFVEAVDWIVAHGERPAVISASLTTHGMHQTTWQAVEGAVSAGVVVVVAAGNSNEDACNFSPSGVPAVITVGATNIYDVPFTRSNYGACVDIHAPGVSITSVDAASDTATKVRSGTSMAVPHVAGAAARILGRWPDMPAALVAALIQADATRDVIATDQPSTPNRVLYAPSRPENHSALLVDCGTDRVYRRDDGLLVGVALVGAGGAPGGNGSGGVEAGCSGLDLRGSGITGLHADALQGPGLRGAEELLLGDNSLMDLPSTVFSELTSLVTLDLSNNMLEVLPEPVFHQLRRLARLDISGNRLESLPEMVFQYLARLRELRLSNNALASMSECIFHGLNLSFVSVDPDIPISPCTMTYTSTTTVTETTTHTTTTETSSTTISSTLSTITETQTSRTTVSATQTTATTPTTTESTSTATTMTSTSFTAAPAFVDGPRVSNVAAGTICHLP